MEAEREWTNPSATALAAENLAPNVAGYIK